MRRVSFLPPLAAFLLGACASAPAEPAPAVAPHPAPEPVASAPDSATAPAAAPEPEAEPEEPALAVWHFLQKRYDADGDARIAPAEYTRSPAGFTRLDADGDGLVTEADFHAKWDGKPRTKERFVYGEGGPKVGDPAPEFRLPTTGGEVLELATLRKEKPVVLVFGSFT